MVETETNKLVQDGAVSKSEQHSMHRIQGHTHATAKKSYFIPFASEIAQQRRNDADIAGRVMTTITHPKLLGKPIIDVDAIIRNGKL